RGPRPADRRNVACGRALLSGHREVADHAIPDHGDDGSFLLRPAVPEVPAAVVTLRPVDGLGSNETPLADNGAPHAQERPGVSGPGGPHLERAFALRTGCRRGAAAVSCPLHRSAPSTRA